MVNEEVHNANICGFQVFLPQTAAYVVPFDTKNRSVIPLLVNLCTIMMHTTTDTNEISTKICPCE